MISVEDIWREFKTASESGVLNIKALARCISLVENEVEGYVEFLETLEPGDRPVIGITGPPGSGKSTLVDGLIEVMVADGKKVAVLCVDPSSPFNMGALLGDRIRMSDWYNNPNVYIRSLASRGSLGGLHPKIIEITSLLQSSAFDYILIETVGVGQSEIEIAGLADITVVNVVPESGDEIQTMKAGLMEIANIFVVNKSDRPGADTFAKNLRQMLAPSFSNKVTEVPVIKATANVKAGLPELYSAILKLTREPSYNERKAWLLAERTLQLIQQMRMADIKKGDLIEKLRGKKNVNLHKFVKEILKG